MIRRLKKQLFKSSLLATIFIAAPLVFIFFEVMIYHPDRMFVFLITLPCLITYLFFLRKHYQALKANHQTDVERFREEINLGAYRIRQDRDVILSSQDKINSTSKLKALTEKLTTVLNIDFTVDIFSKEIRHFFSQNDLTIVMYLFEQKTGELRLSFSQKGDQKVHLKAKNGDVFDFWVAKNMKSLLVEDTQSDYRFDYEKQEGSSSRIIRSLISAPMMAGQRILGVLRVDHPNQHRFTMQDVRFLNTLADLGAVAIESAQLYQKAADLAIHDGLTGLFLRRYFLERLTEETVRHVHAKKPLVLLMMDVDHFKQVNDTHSHLVGDVVLKDLAKLMTDTFNRSGDFNARYGGEEFVVLLPNINPDVAFDLAEQFRKKLEKQPVLVRRKTLHVTVSIGLAVYPHEASTKEDLIHFADQALYQAKNLGRNQVVTYQSLSQGGESR